VSNPVAGPLVSVAIPVYNGRATVAAAVRSVLAQTYRNLEVIVVDDGSTDGTWDVLRPFGSSIRAIRQANAGIAAARNAGLAAATGQFIALMDSDDLCEPERIAAQVRFLSEQPELVLCCSDFGAFNAAGPVSRSYSATYYNRCSAAEGGVMARYPAHGELDISACLPSAPDGAVVVQTYFGGVYEELALGNFVHPPTVLFRRSLLATAGYFEPEVKIMCEWDWLVRVARVGAIGFIDRPLLKYRLSPSQVSFGEAAAMDSVEVAKRICRRDPALRVRRAEGFRRLFGGLYAEAADSSADKHPLRALSFLAASVLRYRTLTPQTPRTLMKLLLPAPLLELLRSTMDAAPPLV
jgi:glycosyltransferase involved in cell wall biosynthesis